MKRDLQKFSILLFGAFTSVVLFSSVIFAQSYDYLESNCCDNSHRSPLDLISTIAKPDISSKFSDSEKTVPHREEDELPQLVGNEVEITIEKRAPAQASFEDVEDPFADEHPEYPPISDPFEGYNRFMYSVNDGLFEYLIEPVVRNYADYVHEEIRLAIKNLFTNAGAPVRLISSIFQGDIDKTVRVFGRFMLNSTIGIGGLFDVASYYEVESVNEDFEQALGHYDVGSGPYLVLPFFGPSSARNVMGRVVDSFLSPTILFSPSFLIAGGITAGDTVNSASFTYQGYKDLKQDAVDPYISLRDFQHQYREKLVHE